MRSTAAAGPPWALTMWVRFDDDVEGPDGTRLYENWTVLVLTHEVGDRRPRRLLRRGRRIENFDRSAPSAAWSWCRRATAADAAVIAQAEHRAPRPRSWSKRADRRSRGRRAGAPRRCPSDQSGASCRAGRRIRAGARARWEFECRFDQVLDLRRGGRRSRVARPRWDSAPPERRPARGSRRTVRGPGRAERGRASEAGIRATIVRDPPATSWVSSARISMSEGAGGDQFHQNDAPSGHPSGVQEIELDVRGSSGIAYRARHAEARPACIANSRSPQMPRPRRNG